MTSSWHTVCSPKGIVKLGRARPDEGGDGCPEARGFSLSGILLDVQRDFPLDGVTLGTELARGGGGDQVSTWTEVVPDSAEPSQETLGILG